MSERTFHAVLFSLTTSPKHSRLVQYVTFSIIVLMHLAVHLSTLQPNHLDITLVVCFSLYLAVVETSCHSLYNMAGMHRAYSNWHWLASKVCRPWVGWEPGGELFSPLSHLSYGILGMWSRVHCSISLCFLSLCSECSSTTIAPPSTGTVHVPHSNHFITHTHTHTQMYVYIYIRAGTLVR